VPVPELPKPTVDLKRHRLVPEEDIYKNEQKGLTAQLTLRKYVFVNFLDKTLTTFMLQ